jgi:hypothetical protein
LAADRATGQRFSITADHDIIVNGAAEAWDRRTPRTMAAMPLYHFSEEPDIAVFQPRIAPSTAHPKPVVWAIDDWHAPMYYFPRDCPRACFWPAAYTNHADRGAWFAATTARIVIAVESAWLDRIRACSLYRYHLPESTFTPARGDDSGHHVSAQPVTPLLVEPVGDLLSALVAAEVELRIMPSLVELWHRVASSTLEFSGTRLRNAAGWPGDTAFDDDLRQRERKLSRADPHDRPAQ